MSVYSGAVLIYLACLAAFALWRARSTQTSDTFLVAGRALPVAVLSMTLLATWIGAGSVFTGAGLAYRSGFPALWQPAGAWAGMVLVYFIAARVRHRAQQTVPEILERHYGAGARALAAAAIAVAYTVIAGYQFRAGGRLLALASGIDPIAAVLAVALCCAACTAAAGMRSIATLDIANAVMILAGAALASAFLVGGSGGLTPALSALRPDQVTVFGTLSPRAALGLFLPTMLLLVGEASMYQKLSSASDERGARRAVAGWIAGTMVIETLLVLAALLGSIALPALPPGQSDTIVVRLAMDVLPTVLGVLLLCGAAAIIVATGNACLLAAASSLVRDVYRRFMNPNAADRRLLILARSIVVLLGAAGFVAGSFFPTLLATAAWAYTMYAAAVTPALLAAFLWRGVTRGSGVTSIAAGMIVTIAWELIALARGDGAQPEYLLGVQTIYPALAASVATLIGVNRSRR